jgi:hypothetical protein
MTDEVTTFASRKYITSLTNLRYANAENTEYLATVVYSHLGDDTPQEARFFDADAGTRHIAEGLERIRAGEFGTPAAYVPPTQEELDEDERISVRIQRDMTLVIEVDPIVSNALRWGELTAEKQAEWTQYRRDLLDITNQAGFPHNVVWPTKPA